MNYNLSDFDDTPGTFGEYDAEVVNAGIAHGDYGEQILLVCKPVNEKMRTQTLFYSMGKGTFKLGGKTEVISIGEGTKQKSYEIYPEIVSGPKLKTITNAGLFLNTLKHLGFEAGSGNVRAYIGLKLKLEEVTANEAIERFNEAHPDLKRLPARTGGYAEGTITMPIKLLGVKKSLKQRIIEEANGKSENEMIAWAKTEAIDLREMFEILEGIDEIEVITEDGSGNRSYSVLTGVAAEK